MARRVPTDLTMLARLYEIWEPQEDARRQISEDLKELFAEAKSNGYNPKALRKAFAERYRLDHQTDEQALKANQTDEDTELYLSALARVRESDTDDEPAFPASAGAAADVEGGENAPALHVDTNSTEAQTEQVAGQIGNALGQDRESGVTTQPVDTFNLLHMPAPKPQFVQVPFEGAINQ